MILSAASNFRPLFMTHGSNKKNFESFSAQEFIAAITQHIPGKYFQMVRYYGWYSRRSSGERINAGVFSAGDAPTPSAVTHKVTVLDVSEDRARRLPSKTWRELIERIWEVNPLSCPRCEHEIRIFRLIHEPYAIECILRHLGLWKQHSKPHEARIKAPADEPFVMEGSDHGWPGYEAPVFVYH